MNEFFKLFGRRIEDIFVRSIMPSTILFTLFVGFSLLFDGLNIVDVFLNEYVVTYNEVKVNTFLLIISVTVLVIGYGYIVSLIQQFLDEFIKENYNTVELTKSSMKNNKLLDNYRKQVKIKLTKDYPHMNCQTMTDYDLYQVLGNRKIFPFLLENKSHTDDTKIIFSFFIALSIVSFIFIMSLSEQNKMVLLFISLVTTFALLQLSIYMSKIRYRTRNLRIYLNYQMHKEPVLKTKIVYKGQK